jgi:type IV pilus assembly protein PilQ
MQTLLRISLLCLFAAGGITVAIALAVNKPSPAKAAKAAEPVTAAAVPAALPPAPVFAPYRDPVASQISQLDETIDRAREASTEQSQSLLQAIGSLARQIGQAHVQAEQQEPPQPAAAQPAAAQPAPELRTPDNRAAVPGEPADRIVRSEGDDKLTFNIQNTDIRVVLEQLSEQGGFNILATKSVQGTVTASLRDVDVETALAAILKTTGFIARRDGNFIIVGTPADLEQMDQTNDHVVTRVYRPNYVKAADLQALFMPLLTPVIGKLNVSTPAEVDIPNDQTKTGGNSYAGTDVVIVRDYQAVIAELDQLFEQIDVKPRQVAIEAMILSVSLSDEYQFGVNFAALRDQANVALISGSPLNALGSIDPTDGGLKFGFLDSSLALFINALETIGDTNVIASPRLTCLNKQRAEIQIGEELGYVSTTITETSATQSISFLDTGTLLRIRPFIGNDGLIRLEVHPELSTGTVVLDQGLTIPNKSVTQVTTNVLCPDGCTFLIGGLIREDLQTNTTQIPLLGNLPWIGPAFRQKTENVDRVEIIVLITPRIVSEPMICEEGMKYGNEFTQRQNVYFDKMSPIAKRNYANHYLRLARAAYHAGDYWTALKQVNQAIHHDPLSRDAINLRNDIVAAGGFEQESIHEYLHRGLHPFRRGGPDYSKQGYPWKEFEGFGEHQITSTDDMGQIGPTTTLERPIPPVRQREEVRPRVLPPVVDPPTAPLPMPPQPQSSAPVKRIQARPAAASGLRMQLRR